MLYCLTTQQHCLKGYKRETNRLKSSYKGLQYSQIKPTIQRMEKEREIER